ncbi:hypothetical protein EYC84_011050 [Monilinia fructicola]|uniref:Uncharacterized protein n=1 Tax=Monilinia fructicola TaxID=38448 RepID=A0A5M9J749_MONFR|nr:hypothetical protein EYC84_011050 [Monilinia fructicola]
MVNLLKRMSKLNAKVKEAPKILSVVRRFQIDVPAFEQGYIWILPMDWRDISAHDTSGADASPDSNTTNPAIPMTVNRSTDTSSPATLTIHFTSPPTPAPPRPSTALPRTRPRPPSPGAPTTYTKTIECKHRNDNAILYDLMELTKAQKVLPTDAEKQMLKDLAAQKLKSERDSLLSAAVNEKIRAEKAILDQARGEVAAASAEA